MVEKKTLWDEAGRAGLILGCASIAYAALTYIIGIAAENSKIMTVLSGALSFILWCCKFIGCLYLLRLFMKKFADRNASADNSDTFRFGMTVALLSALVYSAYYLAYVLFLAPDTFKQALEAATEMYSSMMTADEMARLEDMAPRFPVISFFANLIYCFLFGTVASAIFSRNIPPRNPFAGRKTIDEQ